jgi:hypothetical protein
MMSVGNRLEIPALRAHNIQAATDRIFLTLLLAGVYKFLLNSMLTLILSSLGLLLNLILVDTGIFLSGCHFDMSARLTELLGATVKLKFLLL